jgi:hypothetical protein
MKTDTTYNGWTNYATWRIALEIFDSSDNEFIQDLTKDCTTVAELAENMKQYVLDFLWENMTDSNSIVHGWSNAFVSQCNFYEIAQHYTELLFNIDEA